MPSLIPRLYESLLDAVIGLPEKLFYGTGIPAAILIFKKKKADDSVLFIDASREFESGKNQNKLRENDIEHIVTAYKSFKATTPLTTEKGAIVEDKYSYRATIADIIENDYNLNIPRYVNTFEEEESIDLDKISDELQTLETEMKSIDKDILKYCEELGIKAPIV